MEKEYFEIEDSVIDKIKKKKGKVVAVGTTTCRILETVFSNPSPFTLHPSAYQGWTDLFIYPPYKFKATDLLLTNFHLPRTTLLMLVSAFCGRELLLKAYKEAIDEKYRFYSYGDAMLIL
jgi:S-adenosylmethionine:tRNA ribosyltransferase-isomerase